ncbi:YopX family protein [Ligilactobacillus sp. LYQ139]|uniref:YopX family protein n=1 Tax=Ligilactobacillus sp. LYQ139 TaxID=3378800 RepID=UPI003852F167
MHDKYKFRAWDKQKQKYIYGVERGLNVISQAGNIRVLSIAEIDDSERYVLEQCSGLKDKQGRLIYEGDVVQITEKEDEIYKERLLITLKNGIFWANDNDDNEYPELITVDEMVNDDAETFEILDNRIIGNIHEDPKI